MADARISWARDANFRLWELGCGRRLAHDDEVWEVRAVHSQGGMRRTARAKLPSDMITLVRLNGETEERMTARAAKLMNHTGWLLMRLHVKDATDG